MSQSSGPKPVATTAKITLPGLFAQSRAFTHLDSILKQHFDQLPENAYRVACLQHGELSLFCSQSAWLARMRLMQPDILQLCQKLYAKGIIAERVTCVKIRVRPDQAERFK